MEFQWFTVFYGIECSFGVIITKINAARDSTSHCSLNHWNEAFNPLLTHQLVNPYLIMFTCGLCIFSSQPEQMQCNMSQQCALMVM